MSGPFTVWVFASKFPSTIQPWLANSVAQVARLNGQVKIFSTQAGDNEYATVIDKYALTEHTELVETTGGKALLQIVKNFVHPRTVINSLKSILSSGRYTSQHKGMLSNIQSRLILAPFLTKQNVHVVHSHFEATGHKLLPIVKAQGVPFVITFHGLPPPGVNPLPQKMREEYVDQASAVLVNTQFAKKQYVSLGADSSKIHILPQGTDIGRFTFVQKPYPTNATINVLTVGRFHPDKGQEYALRGIAPLIKQGIKLHYTLVGSGPDRERLEALAGELGIQEHTTFKTGLTEEQLIAEYHTAHIFILPSLRALDGFHEETQGVALQEAQSCGAIVIATLSGGIPECIDDGKTGFLVEDRNPEAIASKIRYLADNPEAWQELQSNGRKAVETHYSIDVIGEKLMALYKKLHDEHLPS